MYNGVFGNLLENSSLLELYEILLKLKHNDCTFIQTNEQLIEKIDILYKYFYYIEADQLVALFDKTHQIDPFVIKPYIIFKKFEIKCKITEIIETRDLVDKQYMEQADKFSKGEIYLYKILMYCLRLIDNFKLRQSEEETKIFVRNFNLLHNVLVEEITQKEITQTQLKIVKSDHKLFNLPYFKFIELLSLKQIIYLYIMKNRFNEYSELNHFYQITVNPQITEYSKGNFFYSQLWKLQSIVYDITSNLINLQELFAVSPQSFKDQGVQRMVFTYNNISRGYKVLKIILEESLFKNFLEPHPVLERIYEPEQIDFKPDIKIIFHGLEDLNLENPKSQQLDLEILVQTGKNTFKRLDESQTENLFWSFEKIKHFNLILYHVLPQLQELVTLWIKYMPKNPKDYYDYLVNKCQKVKLEMDSSYVSTWVSSEKQWIRGSIENLQSLAECIEYLLLKTESTLQRDLQYYNKLGKAFSIKQDRFAKILIQSGLKVDYELITNIEIRVHELLKNGLETLLSNTKQYTNNFKQILANAKKIQKQNFQ